MDKPQGRPPMYETPEDMQQVIDRYFDSCGAQYMKDDEGELIPSEKTGRPIIVGEKVPTVTGLALALGFTSRQALLNYQAKEAFVDTVTRAKSRIEEYVESRLFDRDGVNGAKFSLKNNFKGWSETGDAQNTGDSSGIQAFLLATKPTKEQLAALFADEEDNIDDDGGEDTEE